MNEAINKLLEITPEEEEALEWYQGSSTMINELMGNFISDSAKSIYRYQKGTDKQIKPYYTAERVEHLMNNIINIYSAMIKISKRSENKKLYRLYRGTADRIENSSEHAFISTTSSKNEALAFATSKSFYNKNIIPHLSYLEIVDNIPYYVMPTKGNEEEVLLSPFVESRITRSDRGEWSGYNIYVDTVELRKIELNDFPDLDRDAATKKILDNAENIGNAVNDTIRYAYDDSPYDSNKSDIMYQKSKDIENWKKEFRILMEARCRDVEKDLEQKIKLEKQKEQERKLAEAKARKERIKKEQEIARSNAVVVKNKVQDVKNNANNQIKHAVQLHKNATSYGIRYDSPTKRVHGYINSWTYNSNSVDGNTRYRIEQILEATEPKIKNMATDLFNREKKEIDRSMTESVLKIRMQQELSILQKEAHNVNNQKIGIIGKITGKEKLRKDKLKKLDEKILQMKNAMGNLERYGLSSDKDYSSHDILAEIKVAQNIGGITPEQLQELNNFGKYIYSSFSIKQERVDGMYNQKNENLSNENRADIVINAYQAKKEGQRRMRSSTTDMEHFCSTVQRSLMSLDQNISPSRDYDISQDADR